MFRPFINLFCQHLLGRWYGPSKHIYFGCESTKEGDLHPQPVSWRKGSIKQTPQVDEVERSKTKQKLQDIKKRWRVFWGFFGLFIPLTYHTLCTSPGCTNFVAMLWFLLKKKKTKNYYPDYWGLLQIPHSKLLGNINIKQRFERQPLKILPDWIALSPPLRSAASCV